MYERVHFIGIGGIGMSALAQLFHEQGKTVTGSDRDSSHITDMLIEKGIEVVIGHRDENVTTAHDLVVYSDAVPEDNPERAHARALATDELSYFEALGQATEHGYSIVVSGTHGKTTTVGMIAKILKDVGQDPTVVAGSILSDFGSNFVSGRPDFFVIEGCEYNRHFTHLHPNVFVITNIELDHTDYYHSLDEMQAAFLEVGRLVPEDGFIVCNPAPLHTRPVFHRVKGHIVPYPTTSVPELLLPGEFNKENARAAKCAVRAAFPHVDENKVDESLRDFHGSWRRFEEKGTTKGGALVLDDYAHHPTAVKKTLEAVRSRYEGKNVTVVFHPHLYSRTKSFFNEFAEALTRADEVILLPIYAAREELDESVSSEKLVAQVTKLGTKAVHAVDFTAAKKLLTKKNSSDVIVTMGAGDVYKLAEELVVGEQ